MEVNDTCALLDSDRRPIQEQEVTETDMEIVWEDFILDSDKK